MQQKRRNEISAMNVLFCLAVIFIHIISYSVAAFLPGTLKYNVVMLPLRLITIVVPGFVMLAGVKLFLNGKQSGSFFSHMKKRIMGIIVPYTICYIIYYIGFMIFYDYPLDFEFILKHYMWGSLAYHMYFIPIIFQFDLLLPLWKRIVDKCSPMLVIPFAIVITLICESSLPIIVNAAFPNFNFIYNDRIFTTYLSYWLIGCYIGKNYSVFCDLVKKNFKTILFIFLFMLLLNGYCTYLGFNYLAYITSLNYIHGLYVICACIFLYALFLKIPSEKYDKIPLFKSIDGASFYIYLYHVLVLLAADVVISHFEIQAQLPALAIRTVSAYAITLSLCIMYKKLKKNVLNIFSKR